MSEVCYTATQVKLVKTLVVAIMGVTFFQTLTIRQLVRDYRRGQHRFENLREGAVYLLDILNENNINMTEFDLIALSDILEESPNGTP